MFTRVSIVFSLLLLAACSVDPEEAIIGAWQVSGSTMEDQSTGEVEEWDVLDGLIYVYYEDGSYVSLSKEHVKKIEGTYAVAGSEMSWKTGEIEGVDQFVIKKNSMSSTSENEQNIIVVRYTRIDVPEGFVKEHDESHVANNKEGSQKGEWLNEAETSDLVRKHLKKQESLNAASGRTCYEPNPTSVVVTRVGATLKNETLIPSPTGEYKPFKYTFSVTCKVAGYEYYLPARSVKSEELEGNLYRDAFDEWKVALHIP